MPRIFLIFMLFTGLSVVISKDIPHDRILSDTEVLYALNENDHDLVNIIRMRDEGNESDAVNQLAGYLKDKMSERFYFNWKNFNQRFKYYAETFPDAMKEHAAQAQYHKSTFSAQTSWKLPFNNLKNEEVTAYELRHLARQQKSLDMALMYFAENESENLDYFVTQVADLNRAFTEGAYDDAGNGVYEVFRAGKRIHNWLFNHNIYLNAPAYNVEKQMLLIRTFLHHGAQLYKRTKKNRYGNHHTKGLVALFGIAALFPEFSDSAKWKVQAIKGLTWHIENEINKDGFQFERSVHYHKGDIENYFRVYQLAGINDITLPDSYVSQFRKMFESLVLLAQPNKKLPVLQDDTDKPFAEKNQMDDALTIGAIIFNDPLFRYFSTDIIPGSIYWLLDKNQLTKLTSIEAVKPEFGSAELDQTGYYIMRDGWDKNNLYMTISAGLSENKPDHQHGDMLGLVAYANGHEILPNYQVRYKYPDYIFWKNSWVKNVALVDSITLGRRWKANRGKSGFGKWMFLPDPKVISWTKADKYDHFIGSHNGFDTVNVAYFREVLFLHDGFWIISDHFESSESHTYQQVWQGDYKTNSYTTIEKRYSDKTGLIIQQLNKDDYKIDSGHIRDKHNAVISVVKNGSYSFITLVKPIRNDKNTGQQSLSSCLNGEQWLIQKKMPNMNTDASVILTTYNMTILVNCTNFSYRDISLEIDCPATLVLEIENEGGELLYLGRKKTNILMFSKQNTIAGSTDDVLYPGERIRFR